MVFQSAKNLSRGNKLVESAILVKGFKSRDDPATTISEAGFLPAWSPDGALIAFMRKAGDVPELLVANPNGGGERKLASGGISMPGYSVSPYNHIQPLTLDDSVRHLTDDRNTAYFVVGTRE